jgi:hypothetical protein
MTSETTVGFDTDTLDLGVDLDKLDLGFDPDEFDLGDDLDDEGDTSDPEPPVGYPDQPLDQRGRARDASRGGRPTLYTLPRVLAILAALFKGDSRAKAAKRAGVGVSTFYVWLQLGRAGHPMFAPLAEAVASVEGNRALNVAFGHLITRKSFWKAFRW